MLECCLSYSRESGVNMFGKTSSLFGGEALGAAPAKRENPFFLSILNVPERMELPSQTYAFVCDRPLGSKGVLGISLTSPSI